MKKKDKKELFKISGYVGGEVEGTDIMLFLNTQLDAELIQEGLARDIVRRIQQMRKGINLEYTAKIRILYRGDNEIKEAIRKYNDYICKETLAEDIEEGVKDADVEQFKIGTHEMVVAIHQI